MPSEMPPLDPSLGAALRQLSLPEDPPAGLENRIHARLAAGGHFRRGGRPHYARVLAAVAAAIVVFAAGALAGARRGDVVPGPRYALLLMDGPAFTAPSAEEEAVVVERYRDWAADLRRERSLVVAERLGRAVTVVPSPEGTNPAVGEPAILGIFIIVADSDADAAAVAAASPHAERGGRVAVVRIDPS